MSSRPLPRLAVGTVLTCALETQLLADVVIVRPGESIQAAINGASDGDEIVVLPGLYQGPLSYMGKSLSIRGSEGSSQTMLESANSQPLVTAAGGTSVASLEGFTLVPHPARNDAISVTGGSSLVVGDCAMSGFNMALDVNASQLEMEACVIRESSEAALVRFGASLRMDDTLVEANAGPVRLFASASLAVRGCIFRENVSSLSGGAGAIYTDGPSVEMSVAVDACEFRDNVGLQGGAMFLRPGAGSVTVTNSLFVANIATLGGGAIHNTQHSGSFTNCVLVGNDAIVGGAIYNSAFSEPIITNCIVRENTNDQIYDSDSFSLVSYSNVQGGWPTGELIIDVDPAFADPENGDFRLASDSPCVDAGVNNAVPQDAGDVDGDRDVTERLPFDRGGAPRFAAGESSGAAGCGVPVIVDIGAYEFQGEPATVLVGDVNGDGAVGFLDLTEVLLAWGACGDCCLADADFSGDVGFADLTATLIHWGP